MKLSSEIKNTLLTAHAKALGTLSSVNDINVVPVSSVHLVENKIWLFDYFFNKTKQNVLQNKNVVLTFWSGLSGYQIKANANYIIDGADFEAAVKWVKNAHPNRLLKGLLILEPTTVFDISIADKQL